MVQALLYKSKREGKGGEGWDDERSKQDGEESENWKKALNSGSLEICSMAVFCYSLKGREKEQGERESEGRR